MGDTSTSVTGHSRVVEERVELLLLREEVLCRLPHGREAGEVELDEVRLLPRLLLQLLDGRHRPIAAPGRHIHFRVVYQEFLDDLLADAGVPACQEGDNRSAVSVVCLNYIGGDFEPPWVGSSRTTDAN